MTRTEAITAQIAKEAAEFGVPGWATPTWRQHYAKGVFAKGQRVAHQRLVGPTFERDWSERCTVIDGRPQSVSPTSGDWYAVKFDHGGSLCIHETQLRAAA